MNFEFTLIDQSHDKQYKFPVLRQTIYLDKETINKTDISKSYMRSGKDILPIPKLSSEEISKNAKLNENAREIRRYIRYGKLAYGDKIKTSEW